MRERSWPWLILLAAVIAWFFHESLLQRHSLVPTDILHNLILPYAADVKHVEVKNHYVADVLKFDYPNGLFWQRSVQRDGELPLWNPNILGGHPHLAEPMAVVISPFKLLYLLASAERAFTLGIVLELLLAAWFMFALLREVGRSPPASFIGACAWALNSAFLMWYWRLPNIFCWAPLVLLLLERSCRRESWGYALTAGLTLGVAFLSGNIQASAHLGFLCAGYGVASVFAHRANQRTHILGCVVVVLAVGVLVAATQWLPTLELLSREASGRMHVRKLHASLRHTALGLPALITFVFPALTGATETFDLMKLFGASRDDFTGYIGIVPFTLFVVGACSSRDHRVRAALWTLAAVLALIFLTPLVKFLHHRFFVVAVFAMAFTAAYGVDAMLDASPEMARKIRRVLLCMVGLCVVVGIGLLVAQGIIHGSGGRLMTSAQKYVAGEAGKYTTAGLPRTEWFQERVRCFFEHYRLVNVEFWLPIVCVLVAAAGWFARLQTRIRRNTLATLLMVLTVADLTVLGRRLVPQTDLDRYPLEPQTAVVSAMVKDRDLFRVHRWGPYAWDILRPNWLSVYGLQDLWGDYSIAPESVEQLPFQTNGQFNALLDLANVKYVVTHDSFDLPKTRFELLIQTNDLRLYRNPSCLPRFQFFGHWQVVTDRERMLELMLSDAFNPSETVLLEEAPALAPASSSIAAKINVEKYTSGHVIAKVNAPHDGILLLADTWYPGWHARVDGRAAPLYRADHVLRAAAVPAGEHVVEFYFAPRSFQIGLAISLGAIVGVILLGAVNFLISHRK